MFKHTTTESREVFSSEASHTHTCRLLIHYIRLLLRTCEHVCHIVLLDSTVGGHLHVVIGSTYHCCRRWETQRRTRARTFPTNRAPCFHASYLHVCDSRVRLMSTEMEYDIFAHTDTESAPVSRCICHVKRQRWRAIGISADRFIYFTAYWGPSSKAVQPPPRVSVFSSC